MTKITLLAVGLLSAASFSWAQNACDLDRNGVVDVFDIQTAVKMHLGRIPCTAAVYGPGVCNEVVFERVSHAVVSRDCITGTHSATLSWTASVSSNVTGYNVYRGTIRGGPYVKISQAAVAGTTYVDHLVRGATTYFYRVTAVDDRGLESDYSNEAEAAIPGP